MKKEIEMRFAGMDFLLTVDIDENDEYAGLFEVKVWDESGRTYYNVTFDVQEFENALKDNILESIEEHVENRKIAAAEMLYDAMKEEGKI